MNAVLGAMASVALAALVALSAYSGAAVLAAAVALVVLGTAVGWPTLLDLPGPRGSAVVVALTGFAGVALALAVQHQARPLAWFAAMIAIGVLLAFAREIVRPAPRDGLVESLTGTLAGQVVAVLAAGWLLVPRTGLGAAGVLVAAAAVGAARLSTALPWTGLVTGWVGLAVGMGAAALAARLAVPGQVGAGLLIGVAVAGVVAGLDRLLSVVQESRGSAALVAGAAAPVAAAGVVAYAVARLFV
ncbi:MAG TPA: hypothetical protein VE781_05225 [Kineosporiaceae bacterium]|nr:hypothetical protein [Kineosporiaceae bacterium]